MNESIYNLIPPAHPSYGGGASQKRSSTRSPPRSAPVPPSYSTFPAKHDPTKRDNTAAILFAGRSGVIGKVVGSEVDPKNFLKKGAGAPTLPPVTPFHRSEDTPHRSPVPTRADRPIMGLMTEKNFVHANAVDVICSAPKRHVTADDLPRPTDRPDFGKVPKYLSTVKSQVEAEKNYAQSLRQQRQEDEAAYEAQYARPMPEEQRRELLEKLQAVWEVKHRQFQSLPFSRSKDLNFIVKKEAMEKELKEMEAAMEKLKKKVVMVYSDESPHVASYARSIAVEKGQTLALRQT